MKHDRLVLTLLWREALASLRLMRRYDLAWIALGGAAMIAYATADIVVALRAASGALRQSTWLWLAGVPIGALLLGFAAGCGVIRLTMARAYAPFMKALPVSTVQRRRMASFAATCIGTVLAMIVTVLVDSACALIAKPDAFAWAFATGVLFTAAFAAGTRSLLSAPSLHAADAATVGTPGARRPRMLFKLDRFDRARPTWLGSWAWNLRAGTISPSWRLAVAGIAASLAALVSAAASLVHRNAVPGAVAGLVGGLIVFMLALRYRPLGSPVLRTAPVGFGRVWFRLLWLPLQLSVAFFILPAGAALAAEPSSWQMPVASGLWLLILNGTYAVFAAYFMSAPLLAAFSFLTAIAYTSYESLEYGRTVLLGFAALVLWLWHRARRRYYHG